MAKTKINPLIVVIVIALGLLIFFNQDIDLGDIQATITQEDTETQLEREWTTVWGDRTDDSSQFTSSGVQFGTGSYPTTIGIVQNDGGEILIADNQIITFDDKNYKGQEFVILMTASAVVTDNRFRGNAGKCRLLGTSKTLDCVRQADGSQECQTVLIKYKPRRDISVYDVEYNGVIVNTINVGDVFHPSISCAITERSIITGRVKFVGSKAEFQCDLSEDEVWVEETFAQSFSVNDLEFIPTKLCQSTRPMILRVLELGEKELARRDGIDLLNTGDTIIVNENELITTSYATFFVTGVLNRCAPNQANVKVGDQWVCKDVIQPLTVIVQCETDTDCPQPLKNQCPNYFTGCSSDNFCTYNETILNSEVCRNEVVTIIKEIEKIKERELILVTGTNIFPFNVGYPSLFFNFGEKKFEAEIDFTCPTPEGEIIRFPNPNPECYSGTASFEGNDFDLRDSESFMIRPNINVTYFAGGTVTARDTEFQTKKGLSSTFIFEIIGNPVDIEIRGGSEVLKDSNKTITFTIRNNLPKGTLVYKINPIAKQTNLILSEILEEITVEEGDNEISFEMDTTHLGINEFTVQTFYKFNVNNQEILLPSDKIVFNMNVVEELSDLNPDVITITEVITETKEKIIVVEQEGTSPLLVGGLLTLGALIIKLLIFP